MTKSKNAVIFSMSQNIGNKTKSKIVENLTESKNAVIFSMSQNNVICMWFAMADGPPRGAIWKH